MWIFYFSIYVFNLNSIFNFIDIDEFYWVFVVVLLYLYLFTFFIGFYDLLPVYWFGTKMLLFNVYFNFVLCKGFIMFENFVEWRDDGLLG